jgi:hypothetical protein
MASKQSSSSSSSGGSSSSSSGGIIPRSDSYRRGTVFTAADAADAADMNVVEIYGSFFPELASAAPAAGETKSVVKPLSHMEVEEYKELKEKAERGRRAILKKGKTLPARDKLKAWTRPIVVAREGTRKLKMVRKRALEDENKMIRIIDECPACAECGEVDCLVRCLFEEGATDLTCHYKCGVEGCPCVGKSAIQNVEDIITSRGGRIPRFGYHTCKYNHTTCHTCGAVFSIGYPAPDTEICIVCGWFKTGQMQDQGWARMGKDGQVIKGSGSLKPSLATVEYENFANAFEAKKTAHKNLYGGTPDTYLDILNNPEDLIQQALGLGDGQLTIQEKAVLKTMTREFQLGFPRLNQEANDPYLKARKENKPANAPAENLKNYTIDGGNRVEYKENKKAIEARAGKWLRKQYMLLRRQSGGLANVLELQQALDRHFHEYTDDKYTADIDALAQLQTPDGTYLRSRCAQAHGQPNQLDARAQIARMKKKKNSINELDTSTKQEVQVILQERLFGDVPSVGKLHDAGIDVEILANAMEAKLETLEASKESIRSHVREQILRKLEKVIDPFPEMEYWQLLWSGVHLLPWGRRTNGGRDWPSQMFYVDFVGRGQIIKQTRNDNQHRDVVNRYVRLFNSMRLHAFDTSTDTRTSAFDVMRQLSDYHELVGSAMTMFASPSGVPIITREAIELLNDECALTARRLANPRHLLSESMRILLQQSSKYKKEVREKREKEAQSRRNGYLNAARKHFGNDWTRRVSEMVLASKKISFRDDDDERKARTSVVPGDRAAFTTFVQDRVVWEKIVVPWLHMIDIEITARTGREFPRQPTCAQIYAPDEILLDYSDLPLRVLRATTFDMPAPIVNLQTGRYEWPGTSSGNWQRHAPTRGDMSKARANMEFMHAELREFISESDIGRFQYDIVRQVLANFMEHLSRREPEVNPENLEEPRNSRTRARNDTLKPDTRAAEAKRAPSEPPARPRPPRTKDDLKNELREKLRATEDELDRHRHQLKHDELKSGQKLLRDMTKAATALNMARAHDIVEESTLPLMQEVFPRIFIQLQQINYAEMTPELLVQVVTEWTDAWVKWMSSNTSGDVPLPPAVNKTLVHLCCAGCVSPHDANRYATLWEIDCRYRAPLKQWTNDDDAHVPLLREPEQYHHIAAQRCESTFVRLRQSILQITHRAMNRARQMWLISDEPQRSGNRLTVDCASRQLPSAIRILRGPDPPTHIYFTHDRINAAYDDDPPLEVAQETVRAQEKIIRAAGIDCTVEYDDILLQSLNDGSNQSLEVHTFICDWRVLPPTSVTCRRLETREMREASESKGCTAQQVAEYCNFMSTLKELDLFTLRKSSAGDWDTLLSMELDFLRIRRFESRRYTARIGKLQVAKKVTGHIENLHLPLMNREAHSCLCRLQRYGKVRKVQLYKNQEGVLQQFDRRAIPLEHVWGPTHVERKLGTTRGLFELQIIEVYNRYLPDSWRAGNGERLEMPTSQKLLANDGVRLPYMKTWFDLPTVNGVLLNSNWMGEEKKQGTNREKRIKIREKIIMKAFGTANANDTNRRVEALTFVDRMLINNKLQGIENKINKTRSEAQKLEALSELMSPVLQNEVPWFISGHIRRKRSHYELFRIEKRRHQTRIPFKVIHDGQTYATLNEDVRNSWSRNSGGRHELYMELTNSTDDDADGTTGADGADDDADGTTTGADNTTTGADGADNGWLLWKWRPAEQAGSGIKREHDQQLERMMVDRGLTSAHTLFTTEDLTNIQEIDFKRVQNLPSPPPLTGNQRHDFTPWCENQDLDALTLFMAEASNHDSFSELMDKLREMNSKADTNDGANEAAGDNPLDFQMGDDETAEAGGGDPTADDDDTDNMDMPPDDLVNRMGIDLVEAPAARNHLLEMQLLLGQSEELLRKNESSIQTLHGLADDYRSATTDERTSIFKKWKKICGSRPPAEYDLFAPDPNVPNDVRDSEFYENVNAGRGLLQMFASNTVKGMQLWELEAIRIRTVQRLSTPVLEFLQEKIYTTKKKKKIHEVIVNALTAREKLRQLSKTIASMIDDDTIMENIKEIQKTTVQELPTPILKSMEVIAEGDIKSIIDKVLKERAAAADGASAAADGASAAAKDASAAADGAGKRKRGEAQSSRQTRRKTDPRPQPPVRGESKSKRKRGPGGAGGPGGADTQKRSRRVVEPYDLAHELETRLRW